MEWLTADLPGLQDSLFLVPMLLPHHAHRTMITTVKRPFVVEMPRGAPFSTLCPARSCA